MFVRPAAEADAAGEALTIRGTKEYPYSLNSIIWSPDSTKIAASRVVKTGDRRMVRYVESSPADQVQPKTFERFYAKPGDALDQQERVLIDVAAKRERRSIRRSFQIRTTSRAWNGGRTAAASRSSTTSAATRLYRVIEVDAATAGARTLIDEPTDTFIHYARATGGLTDGGRTYRYDVADGNEIIWMSERDGWAHLYLYDGATGRVKNQITKGSGWCAGYERGRSRAADHVHDRRHQSEAGSVLRAVLPHQFRRYRT